MATYLLRPPAAGATITNRILTGNKFNVFMKNLVDTTTESKTFGDLGDFVVGAYFSPVDLTRVSKVAPSTSIPVADQLVGAGSDAARKMTFDEASDDTYLALYEMSPETRKQYSAGNFTDYGEYTKIQLYVPFFGFTDVDNCLFYSEKDMWLFYTVDPTTGVMAAVVQFGDVPAQDDCVTVFERQASVFVPIPLTSTNAGLVNAQRDMYTQQIGANLLTSVGSGLATAAMGGFSPASIGLGIAQTAISAAASMETASANINALRYSASSTSIGNSFPSAGCFSPYVIVRKYDVYYPENTGSLIGFPSYATYTLGDMAGYTLIKDIHMPVLSTTQESSELYDILTKQGVIFNRELPTPEPEPVTPTEPEDPSEPTTEQVYSPFRGTFRITAGIGIYLPGGTQPQTHYGIDLVGGLEANNAVYSVTSGWVVEYVGWENANKTTQGFGYYVRLRNIDTSSKWYGYKLYYAHLVANSSHLLVGQELTRGTYIGLMGSTGNAKGAHLHLELRYPDGSKIPPIQYPEHSAEYPAEYQPLCQLTGLPNPPYNTAYKCTYDWTTGELTYEVL